MAPAVLARPQPMSSAEFQVLDTDRMAEVAMRHQALRKFMQARGYQGVLLEEPENLAWMTAGSVLDRGGRTGTTAALFVTPEARVIVCGNADTAQLCEVDLAGMGFQLKERPWYEPRAVLLADLCRGRNVLSDRAQGSPGVAVEDLSAVRLPLTPHAWNQLRDGGRILAHAVESTARGITRGRTEAEIAGELSHRLIKHGVWPERLQILADARNLRFRHWTCQDSPVTSVCTVSAVGRYKGLYVGAARTVSLGECPGDVISHFQQAALVYGTGLYFSQPNWEFSEIWQRVRRIYEKFGAESEWALADQADVVEYAFGTASLGPHAAYRVNVGVPIYWHPSVMTVALGDTVLATDRGVELITPATDWPQVNVNVKGTDVSVPAILMLEPR